MTVGELVQNIADILEVPVSMFSKVVMAGPGNINIRLTDQYLRYISVFLEILCL